MNPTAPAAPSTSKPSVTLKTLATVAKFTGLLAGLQAVPFIPPQYGFFIFAGAQILHDAISRIGDLLDNGAADGSFGK